ncbi:MAG: type II secretion system protein, partial [Planctomycetota bacterium]|nr:type II secretion system protein [Planctomycetota bacterium]
MRAPHRERGMTLIEIAVAITILATITTLIVTVISGTVRGRDIADEELSRPKIANAILGQIFKDFRYIWWGGMTGNVGFLGKNGTRAGKDADVVHFITARRTRITGSEDDGSRREDDRPSPLSEVGYALKSNDVEGDGLWLELWRREDYFVDDKPTEGGTYTLVYDKIRKFDMRYFATPDLQSTEDRYGAEEWDSRIKKGVPYAIILR